MKFQRYLVTWVVVALGINWLSWVIGYYCNAIWGMKFDLASCWSGIGSLSSAGLCTVLKYIADSWLNSPKDQHPYEGGNADETIRDRGN